MGKLLLVIVAVTAMYFSFPVVNKASSETQAQSLTMAEENEEEQSFVPAINPLIDIKRLLTKESYQLNPKVIDKVLTTVQCTNKYNIEHNNILTIIDYSLPANQKRLWVFDVYARKLLFHTYVSHGIKSGALISNYFSNRYNSKASSIGVYKTDKSYYGREGLSLRLTGLDPSFNDNASNRSVVMHGGWYMDEKFIQKYGRPGRSWGCPALPLQEYKGIINTIKENSLLVIYYPSEQWFGKSKFLNCDMPNSAISKTTIPPEAPFIPVEKQFREDIYLAQLKIKTKAEGKEAVLAMNADDYMHLFDVKPPLERMLRRQINGSEYIALSDVELAQMAKNKNLDNAAILKTVHFVIPVLVMSHGYYETQMQIIDLGNIKEIKTSADPAQSNDYTVYFSDKPAVALRATNQFIRWLGL